MIVKGKIKSAIKLVLYAPEGFGKSTFASKAPDPVFIDTEGSTKMLDVCRFDDDMSDWSNILNAVQFILDHADGDGAYQTLVIDTADWAEKACIDYTIKHGGQAIKGIEDFGYGKGYVYVQENFQKLLEKLEQVVKKGINVVILAHAQMRKFEQPDEMGAYDRWELKLSKKDAPLLKEWADVVLFGNYKTYVVEDSKTKSKKAQGNKRVMYATHHPCWDAKNRHGLPDEMPFEFDQVAHLFLTGKLPKETKQKTEEPKESKEELPQNSIEARKKMIMDANVPDRLRELMLKHNITEWDIQNAVASIKNSKYTTMTPVADYDPDFLQHVVIEKFDGMLKKIEQINKDNHIPFGE